MDIRNKKGFFGIDDIIVVAVICIATGFWGPGLVKSAGDLWNGGSKNQVKQTLKHTESYPIGHMDAKGNFVKIGDYKLVDDKLNMTVAEPPETLLHKFLSLGFMAIVICVLVGGGITALGAWPWVKTEFAKLKATIAAKEAAHQDTLYDAKCIVVSVKAGLATIADPAVKQKFLDAMSMEQDQSTEDLVKELLKGT